MQDRFRYRVFDNDDKKMHDVIFLNYENNSVEWYNDNNKKRAAFIDEVSIVQCTGLKDKNGKLIYEGDIVKVQCNREDKGGLFFKFGLVTYNIEEKNEHGHADSSFYLKINNKDNDMCALFSSEKTEIIGNIYENPELLEKINETR